MQSHFKASLFLQQICKIVYDVVTFLYIISRHCVQGEVLSLFFLKITNHECDLFHNFVSLHFTLMCYHPRSIAVPFIFSVSLASFIIYDLGCVLNSIYAFYYQKQLLIITWNSILTHVFLQHCLFFKMLTLSVLTSSF